MSARPAGLAPLKTGEYDKLLKRWGFTPIEHGGNHPMYLAPNGITRFPISAADKVTQRELRQAAKLVGVSRRAFLAGPPKNRPIRTVQVDPDELIRKAQAELDERVEIAEQRAKEKQVAKVIEETPKRGPGRPKGQTNNSPTTVVNQVRKLFADNPDKAFRSVEVMEALGLKWSQVGNPIKRLHEGGTIVQVEPRGPYMLAPPPSKRAPEQGPRNGNLRNDILRLMEENEGRPLSIDLVVEKLGTVRSSTANALLSLSRIGAIRQLGRGIYQFDAPQNGKGFVSDETPVVSSHPDDEPIDLYPTEQEYIESGRAAGERLMVALSTPQSTLWEEMKDLGDGRFLLRDENGDLWVAKMQRLELI